jgi:hypothetical protein
MPTFPEVRVGEPLRHEALTVFLLFAPARDGAEYLLADEGLAAGAVTVEEVSEAGSVPNLVVDNRTDSPVLFLEGEELRGAKQNRVLNASVLVGAKGRTTIPVSCVEQGRWHYRARCFGSGGSHASYRLRHVLRSSVTRSAQAGRGHGSDQGEVWREVSRQMESLGSSSETMAMADTYEAHSHSLAEFRDRLKYVEGASGLAVALGGKVVSVDLFDRPATCRKVWERLLSGVVMDALEAGPAAAEAAGADVEALLAYLGSAPWQPTKAVGVGEEFRCEGEGKHAAALVHDGAVVHGSVLVPA